MTTPAKTPHKKHPLIIFVIEILTSRAGFHLAQTHTYKDKKRA